MNLRHVLINLALFVLSCAASAFAQPAITGTSGTFSHNSSLTITGSGFGTKATPGPTVYDDASGTTITTLWTGAWPNASSNSFYDMAYRGVTNGVGMPHSRISQYMTGAHGECCSADTGQAVMFWKSWTPSYPVKVWMSWYERVDPNWVEETAANLPNNKRIDYSVGTEPYDPNNWYMDFNRDDNGDITTTGPTELCANRDNPGAGLNCAGAMTFPQETQGWNKMELQATITRDTTGSWSLRALRAGSTNVVVLTLGTGFWVYDDTSWPIGSRTLAVGGYERKQSTPNNRRYYADIYLDLSSQAHVVLGEAATYAACTIREAQIPTAWSNTSITVTQKYGALSDGQTKYLYVMDANGNVNSTGFAISGGAGGGSSGNRFPIRVHIKALVLSGLVPSVALLYRNRRSE